MEHSISRFREMFFEEAADHLANLEALLLQLEASGHADELVQSMFRAAHSIKGASGTFGLPQVARFTHALENILGQLREGAMPISTALVDLLLRATDVLRALLAAEREGRPPPESLESTYAELNRVLGSGDQPVPKRAAETACGSAPQPCLYRVTFVPSEDLLRRALDPLSLLEELAGLGQVLSTEVDLSRQPPLCELDPEACYLGWSLLLETDSDQRQLQELFCFVQDDSEVRIERVPVCADRSSSVAAPPMLRGGRGAGWSLEQGPAMLALAEQLVETYQQMEQAAVAGPGT